MDADESSLGRPRVLNELPLPYGIRPQNWDAAKKKLRGHFRCSQCSQEVPEEERIIHMYHCPMNSEYSKFKKALREDPTTQALAAEEARKREAAAAKQDASSGIKKGAKLKRSESEERRLKQEKLVMKQIEKKESEGGFGQFDVAAWFIKEVKKKKISGVTNPTPGSMGQEQDTDKPQE